MKYFIFKRDKYAKSCDSTIEPMIEGLIPTYVL